MADYHAPSDAAATTFACELREPKDVTRVEKLLCDAFRIPRSQRVFAHKATPPGDGTANANGPRMKITWSLFRCVCVIALASASAVACEKRPAEGPAERAGRKVDNAADSVKQGAKDAKDDAKEAVKDDKKK